MGADGGRQHGIATVAPLAYDAVYPRIDAFAGNDDVTLAPHPSPSDYMIIQPLSYAEATSSSHHFLRCTADRIDGAIFRVADGRVADIFGW